MSVQTPGEDFNWKKVIEEETDEKGERLLDEEEYNHYLYRKERLAQFDNEKEEETKLQGPGSMRG